MKSTITKDDLIFRQYDITREEVTKSIFVQYDVIKIGTLFLSTLLVAIPTSYVAIGGGNLLYFSLTLLAIAFISMSFVFIMGAGEIRIMRGAAFSNRILNVLLSKELKDIKEEDLLWDKFVDKWNKKLYRGRKEWRFQERIYLAMPFILIASLADIGSFMALVLWIESGDKSIMNIILFISILLSIGMQILLYRIPANLSKDLDKTSKEIR